MLLFDAPSRELCVSRRVRTNTPLQALVTLNDPVFVEAASALANKARQEAPQGVADQIAYAYERATARLPDSFQQQRLLNLYQENLVDYQKVAADTLNPEVAALETVCRALLNLNEVLVKN